MFTGIVEIKLATMAMAGWMAASTPVPMPASAVAVMFEGRAAAPVEVKLYDENLRVSETLIIERDGTMDHETKQRATHLFRCRVTNRAKPIAAGTLAMLADVADRYEGKTIEFVSVYRATKKEGPQSPHLNARAIDFRIRGVKLRDIRDYLWRRYREVGVGWYPDGQYIHMDIRPTWHDTSWTFINGQNKYDPYWATLARRPERRPADKRPADKRPSSRPGV